MPGRGCARHNGRVTPPPTRLRPVLRRPTQRRLLGGVCLGIAEHLGVPVLGVRAGFVVLALFGMPGPVLYAVLWALLPQGEPDLAHPPSHRGLRLRHATSQVADRLRAADSEITRTFMLGLAMVVVGGMLAAARLGYRLPSGVYLPILVVVAGAAVGLWALDRADPSSPIGQTRMLSSGGAVVRIAVGLVLALVGVVLWSTPSYTPSAVFATGLAALVMVAGVVLVLAPWGLRLWRGLEEERALRIRESERAEIAAHLHDSVLQTLALIQRRSHDADQVSRLARSQERELREWLYGAPDATADGTPSTLVARVRQLCGEVEDDEGVPVEVVVVGPDLPLDPAATSLTEALREALRNAVRHGKVGVSVFLETSPTLVECFVRDRGPGFDLTQVPADRLGVRESILGRMERAGGSGQVRAAPGGGTEVTLRLPREERPSRSSPSPAHDTGGGSG